MYGPPQHHPHGHHVRFYIVMITLVVGGIFFLLMMNNNNSFDNSFSFTGALVGDTINVTPDEEVEDTILIPKSNKKDAVTKALSREVAKSKKEVKIDLNVNRVPEVVSKATIGELELRFDDLTTEIKVNKDALELNGLKEVVLRFNDFKGSINFDAEEFALSGTVSKLAVNNVALSSKGELKISFEGLKYNYFNINEIELNNLAFPDSIGDVSIGNQLSYLLDQDEVTMYYYKGGFLVNNAANATDPVDLEGTAKGISLTGKELNVNIN